MPHHGRARCHEGRTGERRLSRPDDLLLGLDLGTSAIKAVLLDRRGDERGAATGVTPFAGGEMTVEQLRSAVGEVLGRLGLRRARVAAVGVAGMAESGAALSGDGVALAPVIAWYDARGAEVVDRLMAELGAGLERAIGQRLRVVSSVAKLGWLVDHGVGPVRRWLGVPELVLEALTGEQATDFSLAARTGAYDVGRRRYLPEVAAALGVAGGVFPPVAAAGTTMGRIDARGARWSGLPLGTPVTVAGHDHLAAWAGAGARGGDVVNSVGTAETVVAVTGRFPDVDVARSRRVAVTLVPGGDAWGVLASAARSGIVLAAVAGALGASPADLDQAADGAASAPGAEGVITAALAGRPLEVDGFAPGDLWHAVLAALAARTWEACDRIAGVVEQPRRLVVCGGGSRSRPWLEAKAAARPTTGVYRSGAREAVARGAALYAGLAAGWWAVLDDAPRPALESVSTG